MGGPNSFLNMNANIVAVKINNPNSHGAIIKTDIPDGSSENINDLSELLTTTVIKKSQAVVPINKT